MKHQYSLARNTGAFCLLVLWGLAGGCVKDEDGVRFSFDQPGISRYSGSVFCLGTQSSVLVTSYYIDDLPPWTAESSDPATFSLDRNLDYPDWVTLTYLAEGEAAVNVYEESSGNKLDDFTIRVQRPEGLRYRLAHPAAYLESHTGEAILPVGGGACGLKFSPYMVSDGEEQILYGQYELGIGDHQPGWTLNPMGFQEPAMVLFTQETNEFIVYGSATAAGQQEVLFTGPLQTQVTVGLRGVEADEVTQIDLQIAPYYKDAPEKVGDTGTFVAVQQSAHGRLCRGFEVVFTSETPDTLWIRDDGILDADNQAFEFIAPGPAEVTISMPGRPNLTQTLSWNVLP